MNPRLIKHILPTSEKLEEFGQGYRRRTALYAIANDETVWKLIEYSHKPPEWEPLPRLPQPEAPMLPKETE